MFYKYAISIAPEHKVANLPERTNSNLLLCIRRVIKFPTDHKDWEKPEQTIKKFI